MKTLLDPITLSEATLQLFASSTSKRYLRMAVTYAKELRPLPTSTLRARADELFAAITAIPGGVEATRTVHEVELALALSVLAERPDEEPARTMVLRVATSEAPQLCWLCALCRTLVDLHPPGSRQETDP